MSDQDINLASLEDLRHQHNMLSMQWKSAMAINLYSHVQKPFNMALIIIEFIMTHGIREIMVLSCSTINFSCSKFSPLLANEFVRDCDVNIHEFF